MEEYKVLRAIGKGSFGKVFLVRLLATGGVYAMKVLKKSVIVAKGQVEHTKSERAILCEITHPFIVHLRFAFQNPDKLYLVTDYYNSGTLFYHLRKATRFPEPRAKFYACELLSALEHLHSKSIIYRDLKLENILMSHTGHIGNPGKRLYNCLSINQHTLFSTNFRSFNGLRAFETRCRRQWWGHNILWDC